MGRTNSTDGGITLSPKAPLVCSPANLHRMDSTAAAEGQEDSRRPGGGEGVEPVVVHQDGDEVVADQQPLCGTVRGGARRNIARIKLQRMQKDQTVGNWKKSAKTAEAAS